MVGDPCRRHPPAPDVFFFYLLFNQTPVAEEQIMEFSGGEGACTQPTSECALALFFFFLAVKAPV